MKEKLKAIGMAYGAAMLILVIIALFHFVIHLAIKFNW